jgi:hypothetical protein
MVFAVAAFEEWSNANGPRQPSHAAAPQVPTPRPSQPPVPSARETNQPQQQNATAEPSIGKQDQATASQNLTAPNQIFSPYITPNAGNATGDSDQKASADWWLVAFTGGLLIAAIATYFTFRRQAEIMAGTLAQMGADAKLAHDEFILAHRPRIKVRDFQTLDTSIKNIGQRSPGRSTREISITFIYINTGDLPATIIEIRTNLTVSKDAPVSPLFSISKIGKVLDRGEPDIFEIPATNDFAMHIGFVEGAGLAEGAAWVTGVIVYHDPEGKRGETGFRRMSHDGVRWERGPKSQYEYRN